MEKLYTNVLFLSTLNKYRKYFSRLNKKIKNGSFYQMAAHKRRALLRKVEKLRNKLELFQSGAVKYAGAGALVLTLGMGVSQAQVPGPFNQNTPKNPFPVTSTNTPVNFAAYYGTELVVFADLDNDGDLDIIGGNYDDFKYFKNTGSVTYPVYTEQTGTNNPLDGITVNNYAAPTLADFDNDGDVDMVAGQNGGFLRYFQNTGSATTPSFSEITGTLSPFDGLASLGDELVPFAVDIDNDGDFDLMVGEEDNNQMYYVKNTGTANAPAFTVQTGTFNPFYSLNPLTNYRVDPTFADIDNDGDFDAVVGDVGYGDLLYFQNTGSATNPVFTEVTGTSSPFDSFDGYRYVFPSFADIDNDGDLDLFVGGDGEVKFFANTGSAAAPIFDFTLTPVLRDYTDGDASLAMVDVDNDGDLDAFIGNNYGTLLYFQNTGTASSPVMVRQTGTFNPANLIDLSNDSSPEFVDIDNDGDEDLFVAGSDGTIEYFQNTGTVSSPTFVSVTGTDNPLSTVSAVHNQAQLDFADIDNDGDSDLLVGEQNGSIIFYRNSGTASLAAFTQETGAPFDALALVGPYNYQSVPVFVDLDSDGDFDVVVTESYGSISYFQNTGTITAPVFVAQTGTLNPFNGLEATSNPKPEFWDLDNDTDLDLFVGTGAGTILLFENNAIVTSVVKPSLSYVNSAIEAFPNPTTGSLSINIPTDLAGEAEITVSDIRGNVMFREERTLVSGNLSYENVLTESPSGIYVVKIKMDNRVGVAKIVKN